MRQFSTSGSHFTTFEIRPKNRYFCDLGPQNRLKNEDSAPIKRKKKGATVHFKSSKMFFLKNSGKVDDFCSLCELLTPNTEKVRGYKIVSKNVKMDSFADTDSRQKECPKSKLSDKCYILCPKTGRP